jgi:RHS repeat-associated core domain
VANTNRNRCLYNGKEQQDQVIGGTAFRWYGYGARFYNTEIGRFHSIDKMSETTPYITPYRYAFNNPLRFLDVNGNFEMYASQTQQY